MYSRYISSDSIPISPEQRVAYLFIALVVRPNMTYNYLDRLSISR